MNAENDNPSPPDEPADHHDPVRRDPAPKHADGVREGGSASGRVDHTDAVDRIDSEDVGYLISRNLDGGLDPTEAARLARMLDASDDVRHEAGAYERLDAVLGEWASDEPSVDWDRFAGAVEVRIQGERGRRQRGWGVIYRLGTTLAAAAVVALMIWHPWSASETTPAGLGRGLIEVRIARGPVDAGPSTDGSDTSGSAVTPSGGGVVQVAFVRDQVVVEMKQAPVRRRLLISAFEVNRTRGSGSDGEDAGLF